MRREMAIRHVFFDINGTLFDSSVIGEPLGGQDSGFADELLADTVSLAMADSLSGAYHDFSELLETAAARRLALLGRDDLLPTVVAKAKEMRPFDDADEAIGLLNGAGIGTGALSNSSTDAVVSLLDRGGLSLAPVVGTERIRAFKPHPRVYLAAVAAVESQPRETALVTAHSWDALGAKRAGLYVAWISRKEGLPLEVDEPFDLAAEGLVEAARVIASNDGHPAMQSHG